MERKIKFYAKVDMTKSTVMDAAASAYLEEYCDRYEETLGFDNRTYRACPRIWRFFHLNSTKELLYY